MEAVDNQLVLRCGRRRRRGGRAAATQILAISPATLTATSARQREAEDRFESHGGGNRMLGEAMLHPVYHVSPPPAGCSVNFGFAAGPKVSEHSVEEALTTAKGTAGCHWLRQCFGATGTAEALAEPVAHFA